MNKKLFALVKAAEKSVDGGKAKRLTSWDELDSFVDTEDFLDAAQVFVAEFNAFTKRLKLKQCAKTDHICYKCGSRKSFKAIRAMFEANSVFIYQSIIAGRPIAIIRLRKPIKTALGDINFLELSDQKPDGSQKEGFDHIEIYPTRGSTDDLVQHLASQNVSIKTVVRPHHTTHDTMLDSGFLVRIEDEPLLQKIVREEMR